MSPIDPPVEIVSAAAGADETAITLAEALLRMTEAEDTLRAIGAGEVDAFVVSDGGAERRVFTLATADRPYRKFVENMRDGAATLSSSGVILFVNRRLAELLSCTPDTIVGSPLSRFMSGEVPAGTSAELELLDADGGAVPVLVGSSSLEVDGDQLSCLTFTDLSAHKAQEREISRLSRAQDERMVELQAAQAALTEQVTHDALTGLPNRTLLVDRIEQALAVSERTRRCTAVLFVDLDLFKHINDTRGHAAGDAVLQRVGERLVSVLRPMDTVGRIGGDEFIVLAPEVDGHLHAATMAARLIAELHRDDEGGVGERVGASVGIAVSVGGRGTAESLLHEADTAMYRAKSLGGGRAEMFDAALGRQAKQRASAQKTLDSALDERRIVIHFQPLVDLSSGRIAGFEALARIAEPDGSILPPADFIPVAEDSGLVVPLGGQVLALACEEARGWQPPGIAGRRLTVAVNLSPRQFGPGDLTEVVQRTLERTGLAPSCLHLELTETAIMDLHPDILRQLERIRDLGVQIGLDDFGTGYASLTHLRRLPLSFVKIDQTFVQGLGSDREDARIVAAVVDLAGNLGLRSIAEGVETPVQHDLLRDLGCDQARASCTRDRCRRVGCRRRSGALRADLRATAARRRASP
ncbi:MAG: EAL domain-containing protein [Solirubrobacteraceae bacterium]